MNLRTIPRAAISGSLTLTRLPLDVALAVLPRDTTRAKLAIDRIDATTRLLAGTLLTDPVLREDGNRRNAAAQERARAVELRAQAAQTGAAADEQLVERERQAQRRRSQADARAHARREQAGKRRQQRTRQAAETEQRRKSGTRRAEARAEQQIEEQAAEARLTVLEEQADAQREREKALIEADEARRLEAAAERAKEERTEG